MDSTHQDEDLYFFHSFPRRKESGEGIEKALNILDSIFKIGLLATPEQFDWVEAKKDGTFFSPWTMRQLTTCFTVLPRSEIKSHAKTFGTLFTRI